MHTDPAVRARGLGATLTRATVREARDAGDEIAALKGGTTKAAPFYGRIGLRTVCEVGIYEREPGAPGA